MKLNASRRVKLIVFKILEYAEIGGMEPEDCGTVFEAVGNCLDETANTMPDLESQIHQILASDEWCDDEA
jgi:hypothetical protein